MNSSFSANALAVAGLKPGGSVTSGGVTFTWPVGSTCEPDDVLAAGQTATITYTDGSTSTVQLGLSDWAGTAATGENTVASTPYRNSSSGTSQQLTISVYEVSLPLTAGKTVASVTLPYVGDSLAGVTAMHIFAIALG